MHSTLAKKNKQTYKATKMLLHHRHSSSVNGDTVGRAAHQKSSSSSLCEYAAMLGKQNQVNERGPEGNEKNQNQK